MLSMIKRNLLLYFRNKSGVFFSLFGAMISFILYIIFLKKGISSDWGSIKDKSQLMDTWLISGTLTITGMTTTLTSLSQLVKDKESQVVDDLRLTDAGPMRLQLSYIISAALIGFFMQIMMLVVMFGYFALSDNITIPYNQLINVLIIIVLNAILSTLINYLIISRLKSVDSLSKLSSIVGTASGFLVGTYVPIGGLPSFAQLLMKLTPGSYIASLFRQTLMHHPVNAAFVQKSAIVDFNQIMGVKIKWTSLLTTSQTYGLVIAIIVALMLLISWPLYRQSQFQKI